MELRQVEYFLAVVENGGVGGAASALGVAQPTVSQAIRSLERELGTALFHRIGRGMVITSAGRNLVGPSRQILRDVMAAKDSLATARGELGGRLDVVVGPALGAGVLTQLVAEFRTRHPHVFISLTHLADEAEAESLIRDGHCEFVVGHLPLPGTEDLDEHELGEHEFWLVYPLGTDLPADDPLPLSHAPDVPMVIVPHGASYADEIEEAVRRSGRTPRASVITEHREARLPLVLAGVGGTFLERSDAEALRGTCEVRAIEPPITRAYGLVYDSAALSPAGHAFIELARAEQG